MPRLAAMAVLLCALVVGGCGSSKTVSTGPASAAASSSASASAPSGGSTAASGSLSPGGGSTAASGSPSPGAASSCPTANTRSFAKTRFVADVGGSLFLMRRYVLQPYQAGSFRKGAKGRTKAIIKAGVAAATTAKLVKNASENAKANPTL